MRAFIGFALALALAIVPGGIPFGPVPAAIAKGEREVPLSPQWAAYARLSEISLTVRECGIFEFQGGFRMGDLERAARAAAAAWAFAGGVRLFIKVGSCENGLPRFGNGQNEIYWTGRVRPSGEFGDYVVLYTSDKTRIVEQDIRVDAFRIAQAARTLGIERDVALYNALLHELGHALGLGDAYGVDPTGCGWSAMLKLCARGRITPTAYDREALAQIFRSVPPAPSSAPHSALVELDTNGNGRLDDEEVFRVIDRWVQGELADEVLFAAIEAWIGGKPLRSLRYRAVGGDRAWVTWELYDLRGHRVRSAYGCTFADPRSVRQRSIASLLAPDLPAGVYFVAVRDCRTGAAALQLIAKGP